MIELNGVRDALAELTAAPPRFFRAPGRLTLMGDHVDYSEGFTLPIAIDRASVAAAAPRADRIVRLRSVERNEIAEFSLDGPHEPAGTWIDYAHGVALALARRNVALAGIDLAIRTLLPPQAGLASSAALSIATALALLAASAADLSALEIAHLAWEASQFAGSQSGIGTELAVALGQRDHALLVDCRSIEASAIPFVLDGTAVVVCASHARRPDAPELWTQRRAECDEAATILRAILPKVKTLRDVSLADFLRTGEQLPPVLRRRTRHVVTENVRVLQTVAAIRAGDAAAIGGRMNESHTSLRDDCEASTAELDVLVDTARAVEGTYGSRLTGGGFGGSTVSLVRRDALPAFRAAVTASYRNAFGREPGILEVRAADGAAPIA
ncbi:MAG: galactokinase [Candidatus Velthaea sp.]